MTSVLDEDREGTLGDNTYLFDILVSTILIRNFFTYLWGSLRVSRKGDSIHVFED